MNYFNNLFLPPIPFKLAHELTVKKGQNDTFGVFTDYYKFGNVFLLPEPVKRESSSLGQQLYYGRKYVDECESWSKLKTRRHHWLREHRKLYSKEFEEELMNEIKRYVKENAEFGVDKVFLDSTDRDWKRKSLLYKFWPGRWFVKNEDIINVVVKPHLKENSLRLYYHPFRYTAYNDVFFNSTGYHTYLKYCR